MALEGTPLALSLRTRLHAYPHLEPVLQALEEQYAHNHDSVDSDSNNLNDGMVWRGTLKGVAYWDAVHTAWRSGLFTKRKEYAAIYE